MAARALSAACDAARSNSATSTAARFPAALAGDGTAVAAHERTPVDGRCRWGGERLDLGYALDALFSRTHTPQGVPKR